MSEVGTPVDLNDPNTQMRIALGYLLVAVTAVKDVRLTAEHIEMVEAIAVAESFVQKAFGVLPEALRTECVMLARADYRRRYGNAK